VLEKAASMVSKSASYGLVLYGAVFSAFVAVILTALWSVILFALPAGAIHSVAEAAKTFLVMCGFAAIPAGGFGLVAGAVGGTWLIYRAGRFRSIKQLALETALVGVALSALFPAALWAVGWSGGNPEYLLRQSKALLFCVGVGCPTAVLFALAFRHRILNSDNLDKQQPGSGSQSG
jgi:hypothetical protein